MKIRLRLEYANGVAATRWLRHRRRRYAFVALLCHFFLYKIGGLTGFIIIIIKIIIIIIIIITLFQEDNIFGRVASLTYGPQLTNVGMIL